VNRIRHAWAMLTWKPTWHRVFYGGHEYLFPESSLHFDPTPLRFRWSEPWHAGVGVSDPTLRAMVGAGAAIRDPNARIIAVSNM
jgi:hypothetical protein